MRYCTFKKESRIDYFLSKRAQAIKFLTNSIFAYTLRILIICHLLQLFCPTLWFVFILLITPLAQEGKTTAADVFVKSIDLVLLQLLTLRSC